MTSNATLFELIRRAAVAACALGLVATCVSPATAAGKRSRRVSSHARMRRSPVRPVLKPSLPVDLDFSDDPDARKNWMEFELTYPNGTYPADARGKAWRERPSLAAKGPGAPSWRPIGPAPTASAFETRWATESGRINSIAVSPADSNLVIVGSAAGGIWRSEDAGDTFVPVADDQVDMAVGSIAFAPSDTTIVYAGMGDPKGVLRYLGSGVMKSIDAGRTWTRVSGDTLPPHSTTAKLLVDPTNPNRVYAALAYAVEGATTVSRGFYLSTDGGVTWRQTLQGVMADLAIEPSDASTLYLGVKQGFAGDNPAGLYRSTDRGVTWQRTYTPHFRNGAASDVRVAVAPSEAGRVYVFTGGPKASGTKLAIVTSANRGATWSKLPVTGVDKAQFGYNSFIAVDPTNARTVYVATRDLFKSTDGGQHWANLTNNFSITGDYHPDQAFAHSDQQSFAFSTSNTATVYLGNDGGLFRSDDGGARFRPLNQTLSLTLLNSLAIAPDDPRTTFGGAQDNGTQVRRAGSSAWTEFIPGDGGRVVIDPTNPSRVYTTYIYGTIFRWDDQGRSYAGQAGSNADFGEPGSGARIGFYPPFVSNGVDSTLYFGTWKLFISRDAGQSWTSPAPTKDLTKGDGDVLNALAVAPSDSRVIYAGSIRGRVNASADGGATWADVTAGLPERVIRSLSIDPVDPKIVFVTVSGFGTGHVFKSTDAGAHWADFSANLPDLPVRSFMIDPTDGRTLFAGTDIGVYLSSDGGASWGFIDGMPPAIVTAITASRDGATVQAATYGRGAYELNRSAAR